METQFKKRVLELAKGHSMVKDALMQLHPEAFKSKDWHDIKTYEDAEEALPVAEIPWPVRRLLVRLYRSCPRRS